MSEVDVFLDLSDLYHRANRRFGRKINYAAAVQCFQPLATVRKIIAFGVQRGNEASGFIACLQRLGIETRFKYPEIIKCGDREIKRSNWEPEITLLAATTDAQFVVLGSGSNALAPVARYRPCYVFGCNVGKDLKAAALEVLEITEDVLE